DAPPSGGGGQVTQEIEAGTILIATGAVPRTLPGVTFDGEKIIDAKAAMTLPTQPAKLIIIGAGPIGMEFAYFYNAFGTQVTVIEMLDRVLPNEDAEVSAAVFKSFCKQGIDCRPATRTLGITVTATGVEVAVAPAGAPGETPDPSTVQNIVGDKVLVAVGVRGRYDGLFEPSLGIELFKDHIKVDKATYQTSVPGIYAVGDVIGPPWLAHVASEEAIVCVEQLCGHHPPAIDYTAIPGCTYCSPQVASLGLTEAALQKAGVEYKIGKFPFLASGKAQAMGHTEGFVKILSDPKHGEILGVHMVGENVTELIAELGLAKSMEATTDEIINTIHSHPTLSEAVHEAALGTQGRMLNF
ncbi:MAG: FAD-dependent oxidoreductase, partial [Planctomycetota bacterium]|nr:FAD-dependent oxidoreductase [Planctomycetota bacterium]